MKKEMMKERREKKKGSSRKEKKKRKTSKEEDEEPCEISGDESEEEETCEEDEDRYNYYGRETDRFGRLLGFVLFSNIWKEMLLLNNPLFLRNKQISMVTSHL